MAKFTVDGPNKLFIAKPGVTAINLQVDLYSDWKEDWLTTDNIKFGEAVRTAGGDPISGTEDLDATFFLTNGWRIRPDEVDHRLILTGNLFTDPDGFSVVVATLGSFNVLVELQTSAIVRAITSEGGGGGGSSTSIVNTEFAVINNTGTGLTKGQIIYQIGLDPILKIPDVALASAAAILTSAVFGFVGDNSIADGETGISIVAGRIANIDTSSFTVGNTVFLSDTPGVISSSPGTIEVEVGDIVVSSSTVGELDIP